MIQNIVINAYFEWLFDMVCGTRFSEDISFRKLIVQLHLTEFGYSIPNDENRARDGMKLRRRFASSRIAGFSEHEILDILDGPCSVLEMMVALAIYCEEHIMDNPRLGDRTGQWFWNMISNLGLADQMDDRFDRQYVEYVLRRFMNREYEPNGEGGLFMIRNCRRDLRKVEIFYQLCWYLEKIT